MDPTIYRQATFKIQSFGGALEKRIFSLNLTEDETKWRKLFQTNGIVCQFPFKNAKTYNFDFFLI